MTAARKYLLALALLISASSQLEAAELVMTYLRACIYCAKFNREVGRDYPQTESGQIAPLRHVSPLKKWPSDLANVTPAYHTPVFILVEGGEEIGRFAGYSDPADFWRRLNPLIAKLDRIPAPEPDLLDGSRSGLF